MSGAATGWRVIRPAIIQAFTIAAVDQIMSPGEVFRLLETPEWSAEWRDRKATFIHPLQGQALYLNVTSVVSRGWDDIGNDELDTGVAANLPPTGITDIYETTSGLRKFVVQAQSWVGEDSEDLSSMDVIERIRHRIIWDSSLQRLLDVNVDVTDIGQSRDMTRTIGKKRWSIMTLDVTFTACIIDTDPIPRGYFNRIILTSHEKNGDTEVADSLRTIEETLPPIT